MCSIPSLVALPGPLHPSAGDASIFASADGADASAAGAGASAVGAFAAAADDDDDDGGDAELGEHSGRQISYAETVLPITWPRS